MKSYEKEFLQKENLQLSFEQCTEWTGRMVRRHDKWDKNQTLQKLIGYMWEVRANGLIWKGKETKFQTTLKTQLRKLLGVGKPFSVKDQTVNNLGFAGHVVSVTTTQLCHCNTKQPWTPHKQMSMGVPIKLYLQTWKYHKILHLIFTLKI